MGEFGWMNDPNGFIHYQGQYHLFYQHYPYQPAWGPMHWGHAVSDDLMTWSYLPIALAPDQPYDRDGCFSGSAIEHEGNLYLMYTGHLIQGPDKDRDYSQNQNLAVSKDGIDFQKYADNPVLGPEQIPAGASLKDFRDPKLFVRDGIYYMVLGSNDGEGKGIILMYRSDNLASWTFAGEIARSDGEMGDNWECPDLFELDGYDVLMFSPQRMPAQGDDYNNLHSTAYMIGQLDTVQGKFGYDSYHQVDFGFDYYAPQTTLDDKGRRIVIAWMETWETEIPTQLGHYWAGAMTLPREIIMDRGALRFQPLEETKAYRRNEFALSDISLEGELSIGATGNCYELEVVFRADEAQSFGLNLRVGEGERTTLRYCAASEKLIFNRELSGIGPGGERRASIKLHDGLLKLRIFVDLSSIEIFAQDGEKVMTGRIYPSEHSLGISAFAQGRCDVVSFKKWDIQV